MMLIIVAAIAVSLGVVVLIAAEAFLLVYGLRLWTSDESGE